MRRSDDTVGGFNLAVLISAPCHVTDPVEQRTDTP